MVAFSGGRTNVESAELLNSDWEYRVCADLGGFLL